MAVHTATYSNPLEESTKSIKTILCLRFPPFAWQLTAGSKQGRAKRSDSLLYFLIYIKSKFDSELFAGSINWDEIFWQAAAAVAPPPSCFMSGISNKSWPRPNLWWTFIGAVFLPGMTRDLGVAPPFWKSSIIVRPRSQIMVRWEGPVLTFIYISYCLVNRRSGSLLWSDCADLFQDATCLIVS